MACTSFSSATHWCVCYRRNIGEWIHFVRQWSNPLYIINFHSGRIMPQALVTVPDFWSYWNLYAQANAQKKIEIKLSIFLPLSITTKQYAAAQTLCFHRHSRWLSHPQESSPSFSKSFSFTWHFDPETRAFFEHKSSGTASVIKSLKTAKNSCKKKND